MYCSELISSVPSWNLTFVKKDYTDAEVTYCKSQPYPATSFATHWAGKEAVFKSLRVVVGKGAGASLKDIEIPRSQECHKLSCMGMLNQQPSQQGLITKIHISLSNSDMSYLPLISYHLRV